MEIAEFVDTRRPRWGSLEHLLYKAEQRGLRWYQSSSFARRGFCGECGASLFWQRVEGDSISVAAGCLDAPTGLRRQETVFVVFSAMSFLDIFGYD